MGRKVPVHWAYELPPKFVKLRGGLAPTQFSFLREVIPNLRLGHKLHKVRHKEGLHWEAIIQVGCQILFQPKPMFTKCRVAPCSLKEFLTITALLG